MNPSLPSSTMFISKIISSVFQQKINLLVLASSLVVLAVVSLIEPYLQVDLLFRDRTVILVLLFLPAH
jgi:hypothetical protein